MKNSVTTAKTLRIKAKLSSGRSVWHEDYVVGEDCCSDDLGGPILTDDVDPMTWAKSLLHWFHRLEEKRARAHKARGLPPYEVRYREVVDAYWVDPTTDPN